jgi:hypothetical protein
LVVVVGCEAAGLVVVVGCEAAGRFNDVAVLRFERDGRCVTQPFSWAGGTAVWLGLARDGVSGGARVVVPVMTRPSRVWRRHGGGGGRW